MGWVELRRWVARVLGKGLQKGLHFLIGGYHIQARQGGAVGSEACLRAGHEAWSGLQLLHVHVV